MFPVPIGKPATLGDSAGSIPEAIVQPSEQGNDLGIYLGGDLAIDGRPDSFENDARADGATTGNIGVGTGCRKLPLRLFQPCQLYEIETWKLPLYAPAFVLLVTVIAAP